MVYSHEKINLLDGGWYVVYKDGSVISEKEMPWIKVPNKKNIKIMGLKWRNRQVEFKDKENYIPPGETHMRELALAGGKKIKVTKESIVGRFIGYYEKDHKVVARIDLNTGKFVKEKVFYQE
jgi:hypothetical protein